MPLLIIIILNQKVFHLSSFREAAAVNFHVFSKYCQRQTFSFVLNVVLAVFKSPSSSLPKVSHAFNFFSAYLPSIPPTKQNFVKFSLKICDI